MTTVEVSVRFLTQAGLFAVAGHLLAMALLVWRGGGGKTMLILYNVLGYVLAFLGFYLAMVVLPAGGVPWPGP